MIGKLKSKKMWLIVIGAALLVIFLIVFGSIDNYNKQKKQEEIDAYTAEQMKAAGSGGESKQSGSADPR